MSIADDLSEKMVFLGGPRQVGKTTLAKRLLGAYQDGDPGYLNWDRDQDRRNILNAAWPKSQKLLVFDEIHKYPRWRNLVKGYFDTFRNTHQFLVTGSARLDYYRKTGESLLGRYHYYRLHPLHVDELGSQAMAGLLKFGGFPEPFLKQKERHLNRWHNDRLERIIQSDVRDLQKVNEISLIQILAEALPARVGSPLSRKSLAEDLAIDQKTVERWIQILETVYYCFRLSPYGSPKIRAVKKEQKLFLWDWSELKDDGKRWENFVASYLLKYCHFRKDHHGERMELRYLRDVHKREVDFVVLRDDKPLFAVECKFSERNLNPAIPYFAERTKIPVFYQVHAGSEHRQISEQVSILPFFEFANSICRIAG